MGRTLLEIENILSHGETLEWIPEGGKKQRIKLDTPRARRLFAFIYSHSVRDVNAINAGYLAGLRLAFDNESDPRSEVDAMQGERHTVSRCWVLSNLQTENFGGINLFEKEPFSLDFSENGICLEGQNGSGKTSLASAIIWCLSGNIYRDQMGLHRSAIEPVEIFDGSMENSIGSWPPLVALPENPADLRKDAWARVTLTFKDSNSGTFAHITRELRNGQVTIQHDQEFQPDARLLDSGILMPCRLAGLRFGEKQNHLYDAVRSLTGLERIAELGDYVASMAHGGKSFVGYAKKEGLSNFESKYREKLQEGHQELVACKASEAGEVQAVIDADLNAKPELLVELESRLIANASQRFASIQKNIASNLDIQKPEDQQTVIDSVYQGIALLDGMKERLAVFKTLTELSASVVGGVGVSINQEIISTLAGYKEALTISAAQQADSKFRLKATAASWHKQYHPDSADITSCPLCDRGFDNDSGELKAELQRLRQLDLDAANDFQASCAHLLAKLKQSIPKKIVEQLSVLGVIEPRDEFVRTLRKIFIQSEPFKTTLTGIKGIIEASLEQCISEGQPTLQSFLLTNAEIHRGYQIAEAKRTSHEKELIDGITAIARAIKLLEWWGSQGDSYRDFWKELGGNSSQDAKANPKSVRSCLATLKTAVEEAKPYKKAADKLLEARTALLECIRITKEQAFRQGVVDEIEQLKDLRKFVETEIHEVISRLSKRIKSNLEKIYLTDKIEYQETMLENKAVDVYGQLGSMVIDARLVANTSWIRIILWSMVFALREEAIETLEGDRFPLLLVDDPTSTLDTEHQWRWAQYLVKFTKEPVSADKYCQLVLLTFDRDFMAGLELEKFSGDLAIVAAPTKATEKMTVASGVKIEQLRKKYIETKIADDARAYVSDVRVYLETLLKLILRQEGGAVRNANIDSLRRDYLAQLIKNGIFPYNRPIFSKLNSLLESKTKFMTIVNTPHHKWQQTVGVAQAEEVTEAWPKIRNVVDAAYDSIKSFRTYVDDKRLFPQAANDYRWPESCKDLMRSQQWSLYGSVAASTNGRVVVERSADVSEELPKLGNHSLYRLQANTLEGVAQSGDILLVRNYGQIANNALVVASFEDRLLARRSMSATGHDQIRVLTTEGINPFDLLDTVIVPSSGSHLKQVVGVIFSQGAGATSKTQSEVEPLENDAEIQKLLKAVKGSFRVKGHSAEPLALDGQILLVGEPITDSSTLSNYEWQPVLAHLDSDEWYLKRFCHLGLFIVLQSIHGGQEYTSVLVGADESQKLPKISQIIPVLGVLYED